MPTVKNDNIAVIENGDYRLELEIDYAIFDATSKTVEIQYAVDEDHKNFCELYKMFYAHSESFDIKTDTYKLESKPRITAKNFIFNDCVMITFKELYLGDGEANTIANPDCRERHIVVFTFKDFEHK